jgi:hypothetical protein
MVLKTVVDVDLLIPFVEVELVVKTVVEVDWLVDVTASAVRVTL